LGTARGPLIISNIFLSTALIYLASEHVGCVEESIEDGEIIVVDDCQERVYGAFRPAALISNIAVISGLLGATLMPLAGAVVDYTAYRWHVGVFSALALIVLQACQIGINSNTWFYMAIGQALAWFCFNVQFLATYAYLPTITRLVTERTMTRCKEECTAFVYCLVPKISQLTLPPGTRHKYHRCP